MSRLARRAALAATACLVLLVGCGSDKDADLASGEGKSVGGTSAPCTPPTAIDAALATPLLPAGIALPQPSEVLEVGPSGDAKQVIGQSSLGVTPLKDHFIAQVRAAGGTVTKQDDEGREAEVSFKLAGGGKGEVRIGKARCPADTRRFTILNEAG